MKLPLLALLLMTVISTPVLAQTDHGSLPEYSLHYDPKRDPYQDGHAAVTLAEATNRRVLIEVGGNWCSWCHVLDRFLEQNPDINQKLHQTFVILKVNVSDRNDNGKFLAAFPKPLGYPHMYIAEKNGNILLSKDTADFLSNGNYSRQQFLDFFSQWAIE